MYRTKILIISGRKELSIKYKKIIEGLNQDVLYTNNLSVALSLIQKQDMEFIVISDTIKEKLSDFVKKIRILTYNFRPIILAVSKSGDLQDRVDTLEAGADDFLGEEIPKLEFLMRFKAHLRRYIESSLNPITHILNKNITIKAINRSLSSKEKLSYLLLKINNLNLYSDTHGEIAFEKVLQTLSAIINSTLAQEDFIGHINDEEFILITQSEKAEKIASFLTFAFDNIINKFYSNDEIENNFTIQTSDLTKEARNPLMRLNIASVEKSDNNFKDILNRLARLIKLCDKGDKSTYLMDRIKLKGEVSEDVIKNRVLIYEKDSALQYLLKNVLELEGIYTQASSDKEEFMNLYESFKPNVVVLDWGKEGEPLSIAKEISKDNIKLIFSSSYLNKKEILSSGADLYLPKPYEINDMVLFVKKFLE